MANWIMNLVKEKLIERGYTVTVESIDKCNITKNALSVQIADDVNALVYSDTIDSLYQTGGLSISEIVDSIIETFANPNLNWNTLKECLCDADFVLKYSRLGICKESTNTGLIKTLLSKELPGTDLVLYIIIDSEYGCVKLTKALFDKLNLDCDYIFEKAKSNTCNMKNILSMTEFITGNKNDHQDQLGLYIVTTQDYRYGASLISSKEVLDEALSVLGTDYMYIIPSSVHEFIAMDPKLGDPKDILFLIKSVNDSGYLRPEDILSNRPYGYDGTQLSIPV